MGRSAKKKGLRRRASVGVSKVLYAVERVTGGVVLTIVGARGASLELSDAMAGQLAELLIGRVR